MFSGGASRDSVMPARLLRRRHYESRTFRHVARYYKGEHAPVARPRCVRESCGMRSRRSVKYTSQLLQAAFAHRRTRICFACRPVPRAVCASCAAFIRRRQACAMLRHTPRSVTYAICRAGGRRGIRQERQQRERDVCCRPRYALPQQREERAMPRHAHARRRV